MLRNNLMLPTEALALDIPEAIDFDGTNDYLSRSSDLVGNADGKTFTFSAWIYLTSATHRIYDTSNSGTNTLGIWFAISSQGFSARAWNASGTSILFAQSNPSGVLIPVRTWTHILFSVDLTNTSNRHFYVNDVLQPITWTTYTNDTIDFTRSAHGVGAYSDGAGKSLQSISHLYLDYTYRNLSVEANRRLFITADRKPAANQQALNPILYLPLNDPTQPGKNLGMGGDFNLTGVVARSGRGPNQYNAPYSDFDGAADYLSRTSAVTGLSDSYLLTMQVCVNFDVVSSGYLFEINNSNGDAPVRIYMESNGEFTLQGVIAPNLQGLSARSVGTSLKINRNYVITVSVDMASSARRHVYVNGEAVTMTWSAYTSAALVLSSSLFRVGESTGGGGKVNGRMGAFWLNSSYADLSVQATREKFVIGTGINAKPADLGASGELPTGTAAKVYLPMYGNNAGKNYGTGGDFTVNSGPFTGARGPNEFWGNKADFDGSTGYLARTSALAGVSDTTTISVNVIVEFDAVGVVKNIAYVGNSAFNSYAVHLVATSTNNIEISAFAPGGINVSGTGSTTTFSTGTRYHIQICIDASNASKRFVYVNGVAESMTWSAYTNGNFPLTTSDRPTVGALYNGSSYIRQFNGKLSEFYFATTYIDFSQEANRLKFRDAFGNPVALQPQIEAGTLPNPAIYMRFPPDNFGKNYGTGGDFTVNGIITDGGQL